MLVPLRRWRAPDHGTAYYCSEKKFLRKLLYQQVQLYQTQRIW
jgi:hypothetical protein